MSGGNGFNPHLMFRGAPERVISLVPSITESLIELGAGGRLVGVTDYCPLPKVSQEISRLGGTRNPDIGRILELKPDLVIANKEENSREAVSAMEEAGLNIWLTFPQTVEQVLDILWAMARLFHLETGAAPKLLWLERSLEWARRALENSVSSRVFVPIWRGEHPRAGPWWMTFNEKTYCHSVLEVCGGANIFAGRMRRYPLEADLGFAEAEAPGERDVRYPRVLPEEVRQLSPEIILLPDEPFPWDPTSVDEIKETLRGTPAVELDRIHIIDGRWLSWHGIHLAKALAELPAVLQPLPAKGDA